MNVLPIVYMLGAAPVGYLASAFGFRWFVGIAMGIIVLEFMSYALRRSERRRVDIDASDNRVARLVNVIVGLWIGRLFIDFPAVWASLWR
jgi:hypothetical protein